MDATTFYILDTSVLIDSPDVLINDFCGDTIVLPMSVISELDGLKSADSQSTSRQARQAIRNIRSILEKEEGPISSHALRPCGGDLIVEPNHIIIDISDPLYGKFDPKTNDEKIITVAYNFKKTQPRSILLTKDVGMSIIAAGLGVEAKIYTSSKDNFKVPSGVEEYVSESADVSTNLFNGNKVLITPFEKAQQYPVNTGVEVKNGTSTALGISDGTYINPIPWDISFSGSQVRGKEQAVAASLMLGASKHDSDNGRNGEFFGSISGRAGSGKTFLAVGCAVQSLIDGVHDSIKIFRPTVAPSKNSNLGFLPGSVDEKMQPWTLAVMDVIDALNIDNTNIKDKHGAMTSVADHISIESINHVRGRGFHNSFIIIDEAQNLEPHEIITLLTRVGSGSCVVMTWDPSQIDNPLISSGTAEGPVHALRKTLGNDMVWHVDLVRSERGGVSSLF